MIIVSKSGIVPLISNGQKEAYDRLGCGSRSELGLLTIAVGDPVVLTAENIKSVYNVEAAVRTQCDIPFIIPLDADLAF